MALPNYRFAYRPLLAGTMISSSAAAKAGTIGCFATSNGNDCWALTAAHVLSPARSPTVEIGQPNFADPADIISKPGRPVRYSKLDVAAFHLREDIELIPGILELGPWKGTISPQTGMVVLKSGVTTGVTRAVIASVGMTSFEVKSDAQMPAGYKGFDQGDSGAAWITPDGKVVGLHRAAAVASGSATATIIEAALLELELFLL